MKTVERQKFWVYRDRGERFWRAMQLLVDDSESYCDAVASLAVHSAISLADAVLVLELGQRSTDDHSEAVGTLDRLAKSKKLPMSGVNNFKWLIRRKTDFEYGEHRLDVDRDAKIAAMKADGFAAWVFQFFPDLASKEQVE